MTKMILARGCALIAVCAATLPSAAYAESGGDAAPARVASDTTTPADIIVTGSARAQRRFDVSYAINSFSQDDVRKLAPINWADLLGNMPGMEVETTGGEVQNITRVRGIPTDDGYTYFQQDGLPLFQEINGQFFRDADLNRYDLMTERVEMVRGGPAPIYASEAAAIVNVISVTGSDTPRGKAQISYGDTGLYRLDLMQSGPLGGNNYYAIGGFIRRNDGFRDNGFPNDRGGQIKANFKHKFDNGELRLSINYLNDHNVFYLPIPVADPRDPSVSLNPYLNYFTGTMNSPAFRDVNIKYMDGAGVLQSEHRDLANGRHMQFGNVGLQYSGDFDGWLVSAKGGYSKGRLDFDAVYSTANPSDAAGYAASYLSQAKTAFGKGVDHMGYVLAGTSTVYDPSKASGLVMPVQYRAVGSSFYSAQGDLSVTRKFDTGLGTHDVKVGLYGSAYGETNKSIYQDYLVEVAGKPQTLDLVAYSASGAKLGSVTQNGVLHYTSTLNQGDVDTKMYAVYANDTWSITDRLRVDAGIRHERYSYDGYALLSASKNLGDATTLADDTTRAFTGAIQQHKFATPITNWTAGINYDLNRHLGIYGRASHLEIAPSATVAESVNPTPVTTKANQYEVGLKASFGRSYLYLTGFYTQFDPLNLSFTAYDPQTGRNDQSVNFIGQASVKGIEADGALRVLPWFTLSGALTVQEPKYASLKNNVGADPGAVEGNQIIRDAKIYGNIRPSFHFDVRGNRIEIYGRYQYTGKRYVDLFNQTALPAFGTFNMGLTATHGTWQFQVVGDNVTNAHGLTEGNTRTDILSGQGTANAIYGRPLFGRSFRFVLSKEW